MSKTSVSGLVATTPRHIVTAEGLGITSFRLAETIEKLDPKTGKSDWDSTNWYTISILGVGAFNVADSIDKGDRVLVSGNLKIRDWDNGETTGTSVEIVADAIGHDLNYGTSVFTRTQLTTPEHICNCNKCEKRKA
jgi:single-strand DNA-binding protein